MGVTDTIRDAAMQLNGICDTPRLDAELLMAHALGMSRSDMLLRGGALAAPDSFAVLLARRLRNEPVAYITQHQAFWDLDLVVNPDVLIPRADSETLIEMAIAAFAGRAAPHYILDLGTGSGALLLAALSVFPDATGVGVDASGAALYVATINARNCGLGERAKFVHASWHDPDFAMHFARPFDLILCNPPYIENAATLNPMVVDYEPYSALFAGADGLDDYRIIMPLVPTLMATDGFAIFEIGATQADAVCDLATNFGLSTELRHDLGGNPRALRFSLGIT